MKITVAHSPDSDDAFMFYGLASGDVPTDGIDVDHLLADIETLNRAAFEGKYEVTAVSFHAYAHLNGQVRAAAARREHGRQYGPIVVARSGRSVARSKGVKVGVPGHLTSAFLTLQLYDPVVRLRRSFRSTRFRRRSRTARCDAGLLIHEGQLTYQDEGLKKIVDLGEWWVDRTDGLPLPLGGNVIRRDLGPETMRRCLAHAARQHRLRA